MPWISTSTVKRSLFVVILAGLLSGCGSNVVTSRMPIAPAKPSLPSLIVTPEGGITLDRHDTERLMKYITELEHGYE